MTHVLIVEDERALRRALAMNLTARGYDVTEAGTGTDALVAAADGEPDVILLDLGLPDVSGMDVIRAVRAYANTPIIVLSARTGSSDKVAALDLGADDYVTKPFSIDELLARLRAATRRVPAADGPRVVQVGTAALDLDAKTATGPDGERDASHADRVAPARGAGAAPGQARHRPGPADRTARQSRPHRPELPAHLHRPVAAQARAASRAGPRHLITEPGMGYRFQP